MEKIYVLIAFLGFFFNSYAQVPTEITGINYQGIARDADGEILAGETLDIKITIANLADPTLYIETHPSIVTNEFGLFTLIIGNGTVGSGTYNSLSANLWKLAITIQTEADFGSGFQDIGTVDLAAVPYAFKAKYEGQMLDYNSASSQLYITDGNGINIDSVTISSGGGAGTDDQNLNGATLAGTILTIDIEDGNSATVDLFDLIDGLDDDQDIESLSLSSTNILTVGIEDGVSQTVDLSGLINDADNDPTNEIELPAAAISGQVLGYDGSNWVPQNPGTGADNWGSQVVATDGSTITGDGTTSSPLIATDGSITNELQTLSRSGNVVTLSDGGGTFTDNDTQLTETQVDAFVNNNGYLSSFSEVDGSITNEIQDISLTGSNLSITGGSTIDLSVLNSNDNDWHESGGTAPDNITDNIYTQGRVGIGMNNPTSKLYVLGSDAGHVATIENSNAAGSASLEFRNNLSQYLRIGSGGSTYSSPFQGLGYILSDNDFVIGTSGAERLRVTQGGEVGIGTTTPNALTMLDVEGKIRMKPETALVTSSLQNGAIPVSDANGVMTWTDPATITTGNGDKDWEEVGTGLAPNNLSDDIYTQGKVGIGMNNPNAILDLYDNSSLASSKGIIIDKVVNNNDQTALSINNAGTLNAPGGANYTIGAVTNIQVTNGSNVRGIESNVTLSPGSSGSVGFGSYNAVTGNGDNGKIAFFGRVSGTGTGAQTGIGLTTNGGTNSIQYGLRYDNLNVGNSNSYGIYTSGEDRNYFSGNVGIGTSAPLSKLHVEHNNNGTIPIAIFENTSTGAFSDGIEIIINDPNIGINNDYILFKRGGTTIGAIEGNTNASISFSTTSDRRLKQNITPYSKGLEKINQIKPVTYQYKSSPNIQSIGFIAQDLQKVYPEAVSGDPNGDLETDPMMIDYSKLTPLLTTGIKELIEVTNELKNENKEMKIIIFELSKEIEILKNK
jgi:hypothetical protein